MDETTSIQTTTGKVRGQKRMAVYGQEFYSFESIPYAKPPVGDLRFKPPLAVEKWRGVKDCTQIANKCLQWNRYRSKVEGSEDCLYLNIYAKALKTCGRLPVMVYVHGGGYTTGDATRLSWGPDYFMMKDVVLITIGYRLGLLGFARFEDKSLTVPGNAGLKDVLLALKWINENCEYFNGDKESITLFGHSGGGGITHLLMLSAAAKGLFHKAIVMAGSCLSTSCVPNLQLRLANYLGYKGCQHSEKDIHNFLTKIEGKKLAHFNIWTCEEKLQGHSYPFLPTKETYLDENSIVTDHPVIMQKQCWSNSIPLMMGCTSNEGLIQYGKFHADENLYENYRRNNVLLLPLTLQELTDERLKADLAQQIQALHFGDKEVKLQNFECAIENESYNFYHNQHRILQSRLRNATAPTYIYRFDFDSSFFNLYRLKHFGPNIRGVGHADELSYIFYMPGSYKLDTSTPEFQCIEKMIECFYTFAKSSNPNNTKIQSVYWEPVKTPGIPQCLNISYDETEVINQPEYEKCCIRDEMYKQAGVLLY